MNLMRYEPLTTLPRLQRELERLMSFGGASWRDEESSNWITSDWSPTVDIAEQDDRFVIQADLPGLDPKDIEITMDNDVLTIRGERVLKDEDKKDGRYRRVERARGSFTRRFALPDTADADHITATSKDGVLHIEIMKGEKAKPRKIAVNA